MQPEIPRSPYRMLAPVALGVFAIVFLVVVAGSGTGGEDSPNRAADTSERTTTAKATRPRRAARRAAYTVKTGDTLGAIAEKTGLAVARLQELNPELDPQALVSGQKIKLRE